MFCRHNAHCNLIVRAPTPWQPWQPQALGRRACCQGSSVSLPTTPPISAFLEVAVPWVTAQARHVGKCQTGSRDPWGWPCQGWPGQAVWSWTSYCLSLGLKAPIS